MKIIINRKMYDTDTATLIASNRYWDGSSMERGGRNTYLYKTAKGNFFSHKTTNWDDESDTFEALIAEQAKDLYECLREHNLSYEAAFGETLEEA